VKTKLLAIVLSIAAFTTGSTAQAASVTVEGDFTGGLFGNFNIQYNSSSPGVMLKSLTFDLEPSVFLDSTLTPPGFTLPLAFSGTRGGARTGFTNATGTFDGSTSFTLLFSDFDSGEDFGFDLDVDQFPCGGFLCLPGSLTFGSEFAGTKITGVFGGAGFETSSFNAVFATTGDLTADATIAGSVSPVPEPATMGLLGASLAALAFRARIMRRRG
jgi:hypothetical protein